MQGVGNERRLTQRGARGRMLLLLAFLTALMAIAFGFKTTTEYQRDSEDYINSMMALGVHQADVSANRLGAGWLLLDGVGYSGFDALHTGVGQSASLGRETYTSQIGLQGWAAYLAGRFLPQPYLVMRLLNILLLSAVLVAICYQLYRAYSLGLPVCFYLVSLVSPWLANYAPNLYWVPFTWYLPMLVGVYCLNHLDRRGWAYLAVFLSVAGKSACGYEYVTAVMLGAVLFLGVEFLVNVGRDRTRARLLLRAILGVSAAALLGFFATLFLHLLLVGEGDIAAGWSVVRFRVLVRTYADPKDFGESFSPYLSASLLNVFKKYLTGDGTGVAALHMLCTGAALLAVNAARDGKVSRRDLCLFALAFLTSVSWYVVGKSHAAAHRHMCYVLWYTGFLQTGLYVVARQAWALLRPAGIAAPPNTI